MRYFQIGMLCGLLAYSHFASAQPAAEVASRVERFLASQETGGLYRSFKSENTRAYAYDQALTLLWLSQSSRVADRARANALRAQLLRLQSADGSWPFAWEWNATQARWHEVSDTRTGAQIWVMLSLIQSEPKPLRAPVEQALARADRWVEERRDPSSTRFDLIRFTARDLPATPWNELHVVSTEHLIDLYAYWTHRGHDTARLRETLRALWSGEHFASGFAFANGRWAPSRDELYLDTQTWGRLALREDWVSLETAQKSLRFPGEVRGLTGWTESRHAKRGDTPPLWTEGTYGMFLAHSEAGVSGSAAERAAWQAFTLQNLAQGIPYALYADSDRAPAASFPREESLAGTMWGAFFLVGKNPFYLK